MAALNDDKFSNDDLFSNQNDESFFFTCSFKVYVDFTGYKLNFYVSCTILSSVMCQHLELENARKKVW